ncbi:DUF456 domain-containing protein [Leptothoe sp. PORK10 BA2]|uniref:DUF456 domain-containing protein n=1 Tax=Leptothoe sp. PORK10 BA2 TaxID=3110254 RepID=UPI002B21CD30|nr:DUF456 family protein [Leptothoe sp. PORK10 BA2]MEA5464137.1 DUF456 family protein [Leptothoe sp. PORK10 BA2]
MTTTVGLFILYWVLLIVMGAGILGAFIPAFPGIGLIVAAIAVWGLVAGFSKAVVIALGVAIAIFVVTAAIDYLAGYFGAKKVGASNWGQIGALVGMVLGLLGFLPALPIGGPIVGLLFGSMAGAFVGEMLHRRDLALGARCKLGAKVSLAIVVSSLLGKVISGILSIIATVVFLVATWSTVPTPALSNPLSNLKPPIVFKHGAPRTFRNFARWSQGLAPLAPAESSHSPQFEGGSSTGG